MNVSPEYGQVWPKKNKMLSNQVTVQVLLDKMEGRGGNQLKGKSKVRPNIQSVEYMKLWKPGSTEALKYHNIYAPVN